MNHLLNIHKKHLTLCGKPAEGNVFDWDDDEVCTCPACLETRKVILDFYQEFRFIEASYHKAKYNKRS